MKKYQRNYILILLLKNIDEKHSVCCNSCGNLVLSFANAKFKTIITIYEQKINQTQRCASAEFKK